MERESANRLNEETDIVNIYGEKIQLSVRCESESS